MWSPHAFFDTLAIVRHFVLAVALALGLPAAGCASSVQRGSALYEDGRYVEAAEVFERNEHRVGTATPRERASYGLYRGLTLLVLGDYGGANQWLSFAYEVDRAHPGALRHDRRALLDRAWADLGERVRDLQGARGGEQRVAGADGTDAAARPTTLAAPEDPPAQRSLVPHD